MLVIKDVRLGWSWNGWSGGKDTLDELDINEIETIESEIEEMYPNGIDETDLNDLLWFERDQIAEMLAFNDWEDLMEHRDGKNTPANRKRAEQ